MKVERASVRLVRQWVLASTLGSTLGWIGGGLVGQGIMFWVIHPIGRAFGLSVDGLEGPVFWGVAMAGVGAGVGIM